MSSRAGNAEIYVVKADGSGVTRLTHNRAFDLDPAWCPNGYGQGTAAPGAADVGTAGAAAPPERTAADEIVRLLKTAARMHERERLKPTRDTVHDTAAGFLAPPLPTSSPPF